MTDAVAEGQALAAHLPDLSGFRLSGRRLMLSAAIESPTLLIVTFTQDRPDLVDGWVSRATTHPGDVPVLEVPVFDRSQLWRRGVIDGGMIDEIGDPVILGRTITVFTDLTDFCRRTGIRDRSTVSVLVVQPGGAVLATVTGPADDGAWARVRAALKL